MKRTVAVLVGLAAFIAVLVVLWPKNQPRSLPFNSAQWKSGDRVLRGKMARQLPGSQLILGKNEKQVLEILGDPDHRSETEWAYHVDIGVKFLFHPWSYNLTVRFFT